MVEVVIVGGGPAGAMFASLLPEDVDALLIEGDGVEKTCGGLLSPDAQMLIARLGRTLPVDVLADPQIFSVRTIDLSTRRERIYPRSYLNMKRKAFDEWMLSFIPAHVKRIKGVVRAIEALPSGYRLTYMKEGEECIVHARQIVGADGAGSLVRRSLLPPIRTREMVAFQQWFCTEEEALPPMYTALFDQETSPACSWTIHKDEHILFGGIFRPEEARQAFERQKEKLRSFGFSLSRPIHSEGCRVLWPQSGASFQCGASQVFLIGEAAGFISPSSFEGIGYAIESALLLREAWRSPQPIKAYRALTRPMRRRLLLKLPKAHVMYTPLLRSMALASGLTRLKKL